MQTWMNTISPYVRAVKIMRSSILSGEWVDYDHVLTYIEQGEADFILNGVKYELKEGDALLMPPYMYHIIRTTSSAPLIQYIVHFDLYYDEERSKWNNIGIATEEQKVKVDKEMELASVHPISQLRPADRIDLTRRFLILHKAFMDRPDNAPMLLKAICIELLYMFFKSQADWQGREGKATKGWVFIENAINFMNERYWDPQLSNVMISENVGISTKHLSFLFKDQLNITIHKYLTHVRIEQAKQKIIEGKQTLTSIAEEVGFSSIHLFSRSFKMTVGITPSQFQATNTRISING